MLIMVNGENKSITGNFILTDRYQLTKYDDILTISNANITFLDPAGEIFLDAGNDTLTISNSTITNDSATGGLLALYLGSGDDAITINNSTLNTQLLAGSGNDSLTICNSTIGNLLAGNGNDCITVTVAPVKITQQLSLGADDDTLILSNTLTGNCDIDFGDGNDTLMFDGGILRTYGNITELEQLVVTSRGGELGCNLTWSGGAASILLSGNLYGNDGNHRNIYMVDGAVIYTSGGGNYTNVGYVLDDVILTGKNISFASTNISTTSANGGAISANNATLTLSDVSFQNNSAVGHDKYYGSTMPPALPPLAAVYGGAMVQSGGIMRISGATFFDNAVTGGIDSHWSYRNYIGWQVEYIYQSALGGAIAIFDGQAEISDVVFSGNSVQEACPHGGAEVADLIFSGNSTQGHGGAIYASNATIYLTDAEFLNNKANVGGGAIFLDSSTLLYSVTKNTTITNSNNQGAPTFICLQNSSFADFDIAGTLITDDGLSNNSIAATPEVYVDNIVQKSGSGTWIINSPISEDNIRFNIVKGILKLEKIARNINLYNWTIGENTELHLSALNDLISVEGMAKSIDGIINLGGGSDTINTNGYSLTGGKLLFNTLTVTGGGRIGSILEIRNGDSGLSLTLDGITLDTNIIGGPKADNVIVTQNSSINGRIALGGGRNNITTTKQLAIGDGFVLDAEGETHLIVYNGASLADNKVNL